jgi:hypothetical protein
MVGNTRMYWHKKDKEAGVIVEEEASKIADEAIEKAKNKVPVKEDYKQLINKEAFDKVEVAREGIKNAAMMDDNVDSMRQLIPFQLALLQEAKVMLDRMRDIEFARKYRKNPKIEQWLVEKHIDIANQAAEIRKIIAEKHDMQYGKKKINIKLEADKKDFKNLMGGK